MNSVKQRQQKFAESIRKKEREEVMSSKRQWIQVPSPVFQLPFRIEKEEWQNFELLLDSFAEKEVALVDAALREYLLQQWQKITPKWEDAKAINVIRILFRLRIAQNQHAKTIIKLLHAAKEEFEKTNNLQTGETMLKLLKEVAINLESTSGSMSENQNFWQGELLDLLNGFTSTLRIYRQAMRSLPFENLFKRYRVFYMVLLADKRAHLETFVEIHNVGELYYLINDCIDHHDAFQLARSIELIRKIIKMNGSAEVLKCVEGVGVLLAEGIQAAQMFIDGESFEKKVNGHFFKRFLSVMSSTDVKTLLSGIELLAVLFDQFDQCISASFKTFNPPIQYNDPEGVQVIRQVQYTNYADLIISFTESIVYEVRMKGYWVISNVTGSASNYRIGLQFIKHIYLKGMNELQKEHQAIINEITICVLNYLCSITQQEEIEELSNINHKENEEDNSIKKMPNCFLFCLSTAADILERICLTTDFKSQILFDETYISMIHRAVFALFMVFQHVGPTLQIVLDHLQRERADVSLQRLLQAMPSQKNGRSELCDLMSSVLCFFSNRSKSI